MTQLKFQRFSGTLAQDCLTGISPVENSGDPLGDEIFTFQFHTIIEANAFVKGVDFLINDMRGWRWSIEDRGYIKYVHLKSLITKHRD